MVLILGILLLPVKAYADAKDPFSAVFRVNREIGGHCTGFAIDARTILTAAHCPWLERPRNWIRPTSLHVLAGYDRGKYRQHMRVFEYRVRLDMRLSLAILIVQRIGRCWCLIRHFLAHPHHWP